MRIAVLLILCAAAAAQAGGYDRLIDEAVRLQGVRRAGESPQEPYKRAYQKLAEAARADNTRWEAYALRGTNRCELAVVRRRMLANKSNEMTARGFSPAQVEEFQTGGMDYVNNVIGEAEQNFSAMKLRLRRGGDRNLVLFAQAAVKYARAVYATKGAQTGAIDGFKTLVKRKWRPEHCSEYVARCYLELGSVAYVTKEFEKAQAYWKEGLNWAQTSETKRSLLTNMASGLQSAGQFKGAKKLLRELIDKEPNRPGHWKNLGLLLGHEGSLLEALHAYGKSRELCAKARTSFFLGLLHGSAWLKPAMIHGKLRPRDGDLLTAWNLFLEYRQMFGDDYNFCFNFGDFLFHMGQYELSQIFIERARDLQPFCHMPHQLLMLLAHRLPGTAEEVKQRIKEAEEGVERTRSQDDSPSLRRLCAGLTDRFDTGHLAGETDRIAPDPLEGFDASRPPPWLVEAAEKRAPFKPFEPVLDRADGSGSGGDGDASRNETGPQRGVSAPWFVGFGVLAAALALVFWLRSR